MLSSQNEFGDEFYIKKNMKNESSLLYEERHKAANELKILQSKNRHLKDTIRGSKEELTVLKSQVTQITDELNAITIESEALKCHHIDLQAHNEGLKNLLRVARARLEGSTARKQVLNIDAYLEKELNGQTFENLLHSVRNDINSINIIQIHPKKPVLVKKSAMKTPKDDSKLVEKKKRYVRNYTDSDYLS
ncbi:DgyrCDS5164 [Dimorphilus gyrociliatus]|uniref:DgyrCDS5164 n=1 Tax=Dimorphilus gyrociliatus TaxID=2664684 RepID=A0A7I8VLQ0_9ANNE|nr:DgyrCDS5164 [Dimorphilus gyrociliatus]